MISDLQFIMLCIICFLLLFAFIVVLTHLDPDKAKPPKVSLHAIAQIESGGNALAFNSVSNACGMYQITPACLKDYNRYAPKNYPRFAMWAMFNPSYAKRVANWYINERIPALLKKNNIADTLENRLIAYNAGWTRARRPFNTLPKETINYIRKYKELI